MLFSFPEREGLFQTTISPEYQDVIPREIREALKVGSRLTVIRLGRMIPPPDLRNSRGILSDHSIEDYRDRSDREEDR